MILKLPNITIKIYMKKNQLHRELSGILFKNSFTASISRIFKTYILCVYNNGKYTYYVGNV